MLYNIKVYNTRMQELARLNTTFNVAYELNLNALSVMSFDVMRDDPKIKYLEPFNFVELFDGDIRVDLFRILPRVETNEETKTVHFECEHVISTLFDDVMYKYHQIGNLGVYTSNVIRYVLDQQSTKHWKLGTCDFKHQFEYKWENENLLSALLSIPNCFTEKYKWEFDTTNYPFMLHLKRIDSNVTTHLRTGVNLKRIEKKIDPTNIITRLYLLGYGEGDNQLDISKINNGRPYLEKNVGKYGLKSSIVVDRRFENEETLKSYGIKLLNELSEPYISYSIDCIDLSRTDPRFKPFRPGDYIRVDDVELPIIKVSKKLSTPHEVGLEIANKNSNVTGTINDLQSRTRIFETYSQGATNLQQLCFTDNADPTHPMEFEFYLPNEVVRVNKIILKTNIKPFRAYSKATKGGGEEWKSTSSGGGDYTSTSWSGGDYTTTDRGGGDYTTTHGEEHYQADNVFRAVTTGKGYGNLIGWAEDYHVYHHEHNINIPEHTHDVSIPEHTHNVSIPEHSHDIRLPDHVHDIDYGIYEGTSANNLTLKIDGRTCPYADEVDIIPYLSKSNDGTIQRGTWHTVSITPNRLTKINSNIFIQLFTNSRGKGDF